MKNKRLGTIIPLILCEIYWTVAYLIYRFGVMEHPFKKDIWVAIFILACNVSFAIGYVLILKRKRNKEKEHSEINIERFLWICIGISTVIAIPNCIRYTGCWYPPIISTLINPGQMYLRVVSGIASSNAINWIAFFDFFPFVVFPLTFFCWDKLKCNIKVAASVVSSYYLIIYCACGRNMPTLNFVFSVLVTYFIILCSGIQKNRKVAFRNAVIVLVMLILVAVMFKMNLASRTLYTSDVESQLAQLGESEQIVDSEQNSINKEDSINKGDNANKEDKQEEQDKQNTEKQENVYLQYKDLIITEEQKEACEKVGTIFPMYTNPYTKSYVRVDDPIYQVLPESLRFAYVMGSMYLSSSYHVLSVAMRMDFEWTYGMGCSEFLMDYFNRFTGINVKEKTYGYRAVQLTDPSIVSTYGWSTAYVQFAGDLTFLGVVLLFLLFGALTALVWIEVISTKNVYGIPLIIEMALLFLFVPANCITFCSGGYFTIFFGSLALFLLSLFFRKKQAKAEIMEKK